MAVVVVGVLTLVLVCAAAFLVRLLPYGIPRHAWMEECYGVSWHVERRYEVFDWIDLPSARHESGLRGPNLFDILHPRPENVITTYQAIDEYKCGYRPTLFVKGTTALSPERMRELMMDDIARQKARKIEYTCGKPGQ